MAQQGKSANIQILLNGKELLAPSELFDIGVKAEFGTEGIQANLTIEELTFRGNARTEVLNHIADGLTGGVGIFEGLPLSIRAFNANTDLIVFNGYLDLTDGYIDNDADNSLKVTLKQADGLNSLEDRLNSLTFGTLVENGTITASDYQTVGYVVEKPFNIVEQLTNSIVIYLMFKEVAELIKEVGKDQATTAGISSSSLSGGIGGAVYAIISTALQIAYALTMVALIVRLSRQLINSFLPPKREHKALSLFTALSAISTELGYTFASDQEAYLRKLYYLPSNQNFDESTLEGFIGVAKGTSAGIPNASDYGYNCAEMFQLAKTIILGNKAIIDNTLYLTFEGSDFFEKQADVRLFDSLQKATRFNTDEANRSRLIQFETDITDIWTIKNFTGTNYQVLTKPITENNPKFVTLLGAEQVNIPVALGNRKDKLNPLEKAIEGVLNVFDTIINVLGGAFGLDVNFSEIVSSKIGLLRVSDNNHTIPKLLYLEGGRMPANHRTFLSAKSIYNDYHSYKSFVSNAEIAQKKIFENVSVTFGLDDFTKLLNNAYLYNSNGKSAKVTELTWVIGKDRATVSYFERGAYTSNLEETFIEA